MVGVGPVWCGVVLCAQGTITKWDALHTRKYKKSQMRIQEHVGSGVLCTSVNEVSPTTCEWQP